MSSPLPRDVGVPSAPPDRWDVLVVGLGPVGAALASLLGSYGVRTLVVDKSHEIFTAPRAIALDNEALRILQMAGIREGDFETVAIPRVLMRSPQAGEFGCVNTAGSIDGHPKLVTFHQPTLERVLRSRLASLPTVEIALGWELQALQEGLEDVTASLRSSEGRIRGVSARYIVGADGASSRVRQLLDLDFKGATYAEDWLIVDAQRPKPSIDHIEFICDPARPCPHMLAPAGRERWEFMLRPGETREQMESDDSIRKLLAPWGKPEEMAIERRAVYRFHARVAQRFSKGRCFLAGDAAHITPPFVGQGLVAGLRDAANLGWKLAWVIQGLAAESILDSYDAERRPHARAMIRLARFMGRLVMPSSAPAAWFIHGLLRQLRRLPAFRRYFDELGIKPRNCFSSGLFVKGRGGSRLVRGGVLPQGWLRTGSGEILLSDELIGNGLTLIGFGVDASAELNLPTLAELSRAGGTIARIDPRGMRSPGASDCSRAEDIHNHFIPDSVPHGWVALVRPDRTILHDGPVSEATRIVREGLQVLGVGAAPPAPAHPPLASLAP